MESSLRRRVFMHVDPLWIRIAAVPYWQPPLTDQSIPGTSKCSCVCPFGHAVSASSCKFRAVPVIVVASCPCQQLCWRCRECCACAWIIALRLGEASPYLALELDEQVGAPSRSLPSHTACSPSVPCASLLCPLYHPSHLPGGSERALYKVPCPRCVPSRVRSRGNHR